MPLLAATTEGVFRAPDPPFDRADVERVFDEGAARELRRFGALDGVFAATAAGLLRSTDGGRSWTDLGLPVADVHSVVATPQGRLFAGTRPAAVYRSADGGDAWTGLDGFRAIPSRDEWPRVPGRDEAWVRSLAVPPGAPDRVLAGVEVAGVCRSDDGGDTWRECTVDADAHVGTGRDDAVHPDVHQVLPLGPDDWLVATQQGSYRTRDAGDSWTRLDPAGSDAAEAADPEMAAPDSPGSGRDATRRYTRESLVHGGRLYTASARTPPFWRDERGAFDADAAVYVAADVSGVGTADDAGSLTPVPYPGQPREFVVSWAVDRNDRVLAGTNEGSILRSTPDGAGFERVGAVPVTDEARGAYGVVSLAVVA